MKFHDVLISGETFSLPSCTGIIELARDRKFLVGDEYLPYNEDGLSEGTIGHKLVAQYMRGHVFLKEWPKLPEPMKNVLRAVERWKRATGYRSRASEFEVVSVSLGVVGHPDDIGTIKQHVEIVDWTTGEVNTGKKIQLGFYALAYQEQYPRRSIERARAVELNKVTGNYKETIIEMPELQQLGRDFVELRQRIGAI